MGGEHVSKDFFSVFQQGIRNENEGILQERSKGSENGGVLTRRENQKKLRQLASLAVSNGWIRSNQREDDAAIFEIWKGIATGVLIPRTPPFRAENLAIVRENWKLLSPHSQTLHILKLPTQQLLTP